jgi:hypothetical protein
MPIMRLLPALLLTASLLAQAETVEEARLARAEAAMPEVVHAFAPLTDGFANEWHAASDARGTLRLAQHYGRQLWQAARARIRATGDFDDRPLYWARLTMTRTMHDTHPAFPIFDADRAEALDAMEQASRGMDDVAYPATHDTLRVLITGFDPFLLDRHIDQSNPSGVNALLLDGSEFDVVDAKGGAKHVHIETAIVPVRKADFDAGIVERLLMPWMAGEAPAQADWLEAARARLSNALPAKATPRVDLVITVSMGRSDFDLERFPGRRRSATAPDNVNAYTGGSRTEPVLPPLNGKPLDGAEFLEFSLPVHAMLTVQTPYAVHDNRWVRIAPDTRFAAGGLASLWGKTAVEGGGGGYYSNEISYRSLRLRNALGLSGLPVGHIHTPAIPAFDKAALADITLQLHALIAAAAAASPLVHQP